ncbi:DUF1795 domain-containing protein (plasmid) [Tistrella mobilis]|jgi:hypothetical protein|uniref:DUF1795 domain-containing protein n=1 Tax=Tistrella mobilis TaxID=171437 RepID=UPI003558B77B
MYALQEGHLDLPTDWEDQSVNVFAPPGAKSQGLSLVVTREPLPPATDIRAYAEAEVKRMGKELKAFSLLARHPLEIGDQAIEAYEVRWKSDKGLVHQLLAAVEANGRALIFTATKPVDMAPALRDRLLAVIQSFRKA